MTKVEIRPWKCQAGHVMGVVSRNGSKVRQLLLYRQALVYEAPGEVDVIAIIEGYAAEVRCSECGRIRTWVPGEEAMRRLLEEWQSMRKATLTQSTPR